MYYNENKFPLTSLQLYNGNHLTMRVAAKLARRRNNALNAGYNMYDMYLAWNKRKRKGIKLP